MMGSNEGEEDEKPVHRVSVSSFEMLKTEVTVDQYRACVQAESCNEPDRRGFFSGNCNWGEPGMGNHPVNCVDWYQAQSFCAWQEGRLPTEAEWEYAARGTDGRTYPWGNGKPSCSLANFEECGGNTKPVGSAPGGVSPFGIQDMAGNVFEWVRDVYDGNYYQSSPSNDTANLDSGRLRVLRGGSWDDAPKYLRTSDRYYNYRETRTQIFGFRCVRSGSQR